ncbi:MAG TPA: hypothetical protein VFE35_00885 [Candidatus Cybelea sp.]|nr:hypothetical protein [Candidatus Cybelea sp.]
MDRATWNGPSRRKEAANEAERPEWPGPGSVGPTASAVLARAADGYGVVAIKAVAALGYQPKPALKTQTASAICLQASACPWRSVFV